MPADPNQEGQHVGRVQKALEVANGWVHGEHRLTSEQQSQSDLRLTDTVASAVVNQTRTPLKESRTNNPDNMQWCVDSIVYTTDTSMATRKEVTTSGARTHINHEADTFLTRTEGKPTKSIVELTLFPSPNLSSRAHPLGAPALLLLSSPLPLHLPPPHPHPLLHSLCPLS